MSTVPHPYKDTPMAAAQETDCEVCTDYEVCLRTILEAVEKILHKVREMKP